MRHMVVVAVVVLLLSTTMHSMARRRPSLTSQRPSSCPPTDDDAGEATDGNVGQQLHTCRLMSLNLSHTLGPMRSLQPSYASSFRGS